MYRLIGDVKRAEIFCSGLPAKFLFDSAWNQYINLPVYYKIYRLNSKISLYLRTIYISISARLNARSAVGYSYVHYCLVNTNF